MKAGRAIAALFVLAAAYDGVLGVAFLLVPEAVFRWFGVTAPNHVAYVQFPAALLVAFAIMFAAIARAPQANRNLIPYGMLLKLSYCGVAFWYWVRDGIPNMWKPWAVADAVFLVLFYLAYRQLGKRA